MKKELKNLNCKGGRMIEEPNSIIFNLSLKKDNKGITQKKAKKKIQESPLKNKSL